MGVELAFLVALVLCLPVVLLQIATAVPAWIWPPLIAADLALLVLFFRLKRRLKGTALSLAGIVIVAVVAVMVSQVLATTPPIAGSAGKPLPGSIASGTVTLNGARQWISIHGEDTTRPVLLFLAGGPGGSQRPRHAMPWADSRSISSSSTVTSRDRASPSTRWIGPP